MKKWILIPLGLVAYWLLQPKKPEKGNTPNIPNKKPEALSFFTLPAESGIIRNDSQGKGHFGALRGTRLHQGLDFEISKYDLVFAPIDGYINRLVYPYPDDLRWEGCEIIGTGNYADYTVKIFYFKPYVIQTNVYAGEKIGTAQAISEKYSKKMKDHIHVEVRKNGQLIDPAPLFNLYA
jgi:murein DD-endopeptidase MepM/ murein hydrolase activator NlpD